MQSSRRLLAIMFTDIVGYTSLMEKDTQKALELVKVSKEIQKPLVEKYDGKWLKEMGDGILVSFETAVNAVECALEIQSTASEHFEGKLRIGIHLGDITIQENDVFGAGVNIASRLEASAEPGQILVSNSVINAIRGLTNVDRKELKNIRLKNVEEKVQVYSIQSSQLDATPNQSAKNPRKFIYAIVILLLAFTAYYFSQSTELPISFSETSSSSESGSNSIAVLAFDNVSSDPDQEYFSDGMSEELINTLVKVPDLKVAGKTSSFSFKGSKATHKEIGEQLGVTTILEGSVRKSGENLRINVQLINVADGFQIWNKSFDRKLTDVFEIQDEISNTIVEELRVVFSGQQEKLKVASTNNPEAYSYYLRARKEWAARTGISILNAETLFRKVIELDPNFSPAYSGLARVFINYPIFFRFDRDLDFKKVLEESDQLAKKALELDPNNSEALLVFGTKSMYVDMDWKKAEQYYLRAIELTPNDSDLYSVIGSYYRVVRDKKSSLEFERKGIALDPFLRVRYVNLMKSYSDFGECENALETFDVAQSMGFINDPGMMREKAICLIKLNQPEEAREIGKTFREDTDSWTSVQRTEYEINVAIAEGDSVKIRDLLTKYSEYSSPAYTASCYLEAKMWEEAAYWIDKAYNENDYILFYWATFNLPEDYPDIPELQKAFNKPGFNSLFELRRKNMQRNS